MSLTIEYGFLIASLCYMWTMATLYFSHFMNGDSGGRNEVYWVFSLFSITLIFLLQSINWLVYALPTDLSQGSILAFQQGVTLLMTIFVFTYNINIYDRTY